MILCKRSIHFINGVVKVNGDLNNLDEFKSLPNMFTKTSLERTDKTMKKPSIRNTAIEIY